MRRPTYYFYSALILAILFSAWYIRRPGAAVAGTVIVQTPRSQQKKPVIPAKQTLEMVFALDTTGSMGGLIDGAKQRIWGIVNSVLQGQMARKVRAGLVAYRDRGDTYVTKVVPLSEDLDKVYSALMQFQAEGGGDTPEDVRQALTVAVRKSGWSRKSQDVAQILFLVGDAPPHDDYQGEPTTSEIVAEAGQRGILVDTIQCGDAPDTRQVWQMIASRGQGEYFAIAQDGGVQVAATPYDAELSTLGGRMATTYVPYGGASAGPAGDEAMRSQMKMEAHMAAEGKPVASAERALNKAINASAYKDDLVQKLADGHVKMGEVTGKDLPASMAVLSPAEQKVAISSKVAERQELQRKIMDLSKKRDDYLESRAAGSAAAGFDKVVGRALAGQVGR